MSRQPDGRGPLPTGPIGSPPSAAPAASFGLRFEVLATVATGSTARVDLCRSQGPRQIGQLIAVKRLLPDLLSDEGIARRFLDEVWMTAALRDPNVVSVVGWGQDEYGPYLASELVQGVSLARLTKSVVETGEQFPERLVVYIGLCIARGLAAAHELRSDRGEHLNLVHRDVSAHNVLIGFQGEVKVTDFGLAKAKDRLTVTTSELPARTMGHVAPEELAQKPVDHRGDIFGLGVTLFELLTNTQPFTGKDEIAVLEAVLKKPPLDPRKLRPKMDRSLASLVLRCLEKSPENRPQSAREIAHVLEEWLYVHGYLKDSPESLARFVRRNSMRQMRWFENMIAQRGAAAPSPMMPRQPSLYPLHEQGALGEQGRSPTSGAANVTTGSRSLSAASQSARRDNEPTVVAGRRQVMGAEPDAGSRRSRTSDVPTSGGRSRRRTIETHVPFAGATDSADDEFDEVPTVAFKVDDRTREELRVLAAKQRVEPSSERARPPLETLRIDDSETSPEQTYRELQAEHARTGPTLGQQTRSVAQQIDGELARLRQLAVDRHELARVAREAAHRAALDADDAEAKARTVERAMLGVRAALDLVSRGDTASALRKLDEALSAAGLKSS